MSIQKILIGFCTAMCLVIFAIFASAQLSAFAKGASAESSNAPAHAGCMSECGKCQSTCEDTLSYCDKQGKAHTETKHVNAIKDCIATCKLSKDLMSRGSDLVSQTCSLCAEACKRCAESCASFKNDKKMQACAEECRKCETSCEAMSK
jgi:hypothetical protein